MKLLPLAITLTVLDLCLSLERFTDQPLQISGPSLSVEGSICVVTCSAHMFDPSLPPQLSWTRVDGLPHNAKIVDTTSNETKTYITKISFTINSLDNQKGITCHYKLGNDRRNITFVPNVILMPTQPAWIGPREVRPDVKYTWTCISRGASYVMPSVVIRNVKNDLISSQRVMKHINVPHKNTVYLVTLMVNMSLPRQSNPFIMQCIVSHHFMNYSHTKMAEISISVTGSAHSENRGVLSIDDYCAMELPGRKKSVIPRVNLLHMLQLCSGIEKYTECLITSKSYDDTGQPYTIKLFEKQFPSSYDLTRGGYLFCTQALGRITSSSLYDNKELADCEVSADTRHCETAAHSEENLKDLRAAFRTSNQTEIHRLSCKLSLDYIKCLQDEYRKCDAVDTDVFFLYHFARLGDNCLYEHKHMSDLLFLENCGVEHSTSGTSSIRAGVWLMLAGAIGTSLVYNMAV
ncbi:uncharacterized protein LOC131957073 [Physella acuta]|uniref:uncharacterized protein LOC131957073 n=1 Tax=Physella acuta TaxID=109671 RepID=UPI0027DAF3EB|nr:uncharacterized protein LOC131957073 [Physella acuta]